MLSSLRSSFIHPSTHPAIFQGWLPTIAPSHSQSVALDRTPTIAFLVCSIFGCPSTPTPHLHVCTSNAPRTDSLPSSASAGLLSKLNFVPRYHSTTVPQYIRDRSAPPPPRTTRAFTVPPVPPTVPTVPYGTYRTYRTYYCTYHCGSGLCSFFYLPSPLSLHLLTLDHPLAFLFLKPHYYYFALFLPPHSSIDDDRSSFTFAAIPLFDLDLLCLVVLLDTAHYTFIYHLGLPPVCLFVCVLCVYQRILKLYDLPILRSGLIRASLVSWIQPTVRDHPSTQPYRINSRSDLCRNHEG